jgi:hypothetical protein
MHPNRPASLARSALSTLCLLVATAVIAAACGSSGASTATEVSPTTSVGSDTPEYGASLDEFLGAEVDQAASSAPPGGFTEIEWEDLVPAGFSQQEISARFDDRINEVEPGSPEADAVYKELQAEYDNQPANPDIDGSAVQLNGFVAPLTYSGDLVTEFLLVPYFGACIHVPPPPANQTVMVTLEDGQGLTVDESWGAVWVTGTMTLDGAETDLANAAYTINNAQTGVYDQA